MKMIETLWATLLLTISACSALGQQLNTPKLDSFLNALDSRGLAMGNLAISQNGVVTYRKAMGYSYVSGDQKVHADTKTKYRIGSATKMFTAVMVFQLIEEGKLKLDQKLANFFPDLPNAAKITLRHMLSHRSGLHDYTHDTDFPKWMDKPKTHAELLKIIQDKGSDFEPGTEADYCNSNYLLLGYIIEKVCKMAYGEALKVRIISRLDLKDTYVGKPINIKDKESTSYKFSSGKWEGVKETDLSIHGGAGSIVSTPSDKVRFMDALFAFKLINKTSLASMETMVDDYGMGMFPNKYGDKPSFGHNGRIEEFYSALWHFPAEHLTIAYCANGIDYPRADIMEGVLKICFQEPIPIPFSAGAGVTSPDLDKYLGKYSAGQIVVNCTKDGDKLLLETRGKVFEAVPLGEDYFMNAESGYFFEFHPGKGELLIKETDNVYPLKKVN